MSDIVHHILVLLFAVIKQMYKGGQFKYEVGLQRLQTLDKDFAGPPSAGADVTFSMIAVSLASSRFGTLTA